MSKTIQFVFKGRRDGGTQMRASGYVGAECEKAVSDLMQHMPEATLSNRRHTAEYYSDDKQDRLLENE